MAQKLAKTISISTLILAAALSPLGVSSEAAFADDVPSDPSTEARASYNGVAVWSAEELSALYYKVEGEREAKCGSDTACREQLFFQQKNRPGFYRALARFNDQRFLVTDVYPEQNKVNILFHDADQSQRALGLDAHTPYTEAYLVWFDPNLTTIGDDYWMPGVMSGQDVAGVNVIYSKKITGSNLSGEEDSMNGFPINTPIEVSFPNSAALTGNTRYQLQYKALFGTEGYTQGMYSYSACYNSTDYSPEVGCHLFYNANGRFMFLPLEIHATPEQYLYITETEPTTDNPSTPTNEPTPGGDETGTTTNTTDQPGNSETNESVNPTSESLASIVASAPKTTSYIENIVYRNRYLTLAKFTDDTSTSSLRDNTSNASNSTGNNTEAKEATDELGKITPLADVSIDTPTSGQVEKEVIFPWWFIILVAICNALFMWLFWPRRQKPSQNSLKKC